VPADLPALPGGGREHGAAAAGPRRVLKGPRASPTGLACGGCRPPSLTPPGLAAHHRDRVGSGCRRPPAPLGMETVEMGTHAEYPIDREHGIRVLWAVLPVHQYRRGLFVAS
jgi:hypothetical protein